MILRKNCAFDFVGKTSKNISHTKRLLEISLTQAWNVLSTP